MAQSSARAILEQARLRAQGAPPAATAPPYRPAQHHQPHQHLASAASPGNSSVLSSVSNTTAQVSSALNELQARRRDRQERNACVAVSGRAF